MARVSRDDATVLFDIVESLLREKMYHSAEIVGTFLLSKSSVSQIGGLHAEALSMFADALKGRGEPKRATVRHVTQYTTPPPRIVDFPHCCVSISTTRMGVSYLQP